MRTMFFRGLIERAIVECYGEENASQFDAVPYLEEAGPERRTTKTCPGIFLTEEVHMAGVAAQAMLYICQEIPAEECVQQMEDFVLLMQLFKVAPYMQWTCIYFPNLPNGDEEIDLDGDLDNVQST